MVLSHNKYLTKLAFLIKLLDPHEIKMVPCCRSVSDMFFGTYNKELAEIGSVKNNNGFDNMENHYPNTVDEYAKASTVLSFEELVNLKPNSESRRINTDIYQEREA